MRVNCICLLRLTAVSTLCKLLPLQLNQGRRVLPRYESLIHVILVDGKLFQCRPTPTPVLHENNNRHHSAWYLLFLTVGTLDIVFRYKAEACDFLVFVS